VALRLSLYASAPLDLHDVVASHDGPGDPRVAPGSEDDVMLSGAAREQAWAIDLCQREVLASDCRNAVRVGLREQRDDEPTASRAPPHAPKERKQIGFNRNFTTLVRFGQFDAIVLVVPGLGDANLLIL
jgi:hypothetical protein